MSNPKKTKQLSYKSMDEDLDKYDNHDRGCADQGDGIRKDRDYSLNI